MLDGVAQGRKDELHSVFRKTFDCGGSHSKKT